MGQKLEDCIRGFEPKFTEDYSPSSVHCRFNTGAAGTGKTHNEKEAIKENPNYGILCATTGIAAINLGATTLNSVLKFYDTDSLRDRFNRGGLTATLHRIGKNTKRLVIDEVSMMDGRQLDYIYQSIFQVNEYDDMAPKYDGEGNLKPNSGPMGIVLTGDFAQLPPIKAPWAFEADCWEHFERNTNTLTKVWRQDNPEFLEAINAARAGKGQKCVELLKSINVKFVPQQIAKFDGTTIMSKNDQVDNFNFSALMDVPGEAFGLKSMKWGDEAGEWKNIPDMLKLKEGALVMILANETGGFTYANGDTGKVQSKDLDGTIWVKLTRNESVVPIRPITRYKTARGEDAERSLDKTFPSERLDSKDPWNTNDMEHIFCESDCGVTEPGLRYSSWGRPSFNCSSGSINVGAIKYYPLRLAYATTVHKSQGLTLDRCQIDCRDHFFGNPSMAYVALSRCRTPQGLTIVGTPEKLAERIKIEPKVRRWL